MLQLRRLSWFPDCSQWFISAAEVTGRSASPTGASELSPRPSWWWIRASLLRMMGSSHLQDTSGHSPDHPGDSGVFLPGVRIGGKSVVDSGMCSSMGGSYQRTQCHLSFLKSLFYWFLLKRCSPSQSTSGQSPDFQASPRHWGQHQSQDINRSVSLCPPVTLA